MVAKNNQGKEFTSQLLYRKDYQRYIKKTAISLSLSCLIAFPVVQVANAMTEQKGQCATSPRAAYDMLTNQNKLTQSQKTNQLININTASVAELIQLQNIGVKKAQAIVNYRLKHGQFNSVIDLTKVKGIGQKTVDKFQHRLTIQ